MILKAHNNPCNCNVYYYFALHVSIYKIFFFILEAQPQNELIPPHFVQEPVDSTVAEGEAHQLECQVFGNPLPLVSWFKDDTCIDYSTDYSITYNNGFCTLKIDEAHANHQGRYTCRAVNSVGQVACSANLTVSCKLFWIFTYNFFLTKKKNIIIYKTLNNYENDNQLISYE